MSDLETVEVLGRSITKIEYQGHRVVTLRQIDEAHEKAEGQAKTQFNRNKKRFMEGFDFYPIDSAGLYQLDPDHILFGPSAKHGMVFTERGYGKIVRGWRDDLSWQLHDAMQESYFLVREALAGGDVDIDLELLRSNQADSYAGILRAIQGSTAKVRENIIGAMSSNIRGYIKNILVPIVTGMDHDVRNMIQDLRKENAKLVSEVERISSRARRADDRRAFNEMDWIDVAGIYEKWFPGVVIPRKAFLSSQISKSLDAYCKRFDRSRDMRQIVAGGRYHNFWYIKAVEDWMERWGNGMIVSHIAKQAGTKTEQGS